ncbi:putative short-chain dehydrogenase/reductase family protein [Aspergillus heteromorphus CBS 117.55]|uniref:Putative short-chain dehydrogenase/reductase family protein n=1 Tax=Aspergillus heteromorphus CBS 117.55 TaxID=1448321 RepID=A0A317UYD4_9EURO|nr:putative short-chain dehydrogenase/reductase family protein [Aspergillus heteromorphus CBS 117.55]PWY66765.1 putative short-chain dehydrogenase/reductase family protein [Aspergillus heteromorphus CBS 117.55]
MSSQLHFLYNQVFVTPQLPPTSFAHQTVIITGSNTGLGLEAARHIVSQGAGKVILAVRNITAGEAARESIESTTQRTGVVEVWPLDLSSYASVLAFADKATQTLARLDVLLENAGIATEKYAQSEGHERTVTVNVISTFLLAVLLLPKLRATASEHPEGPAPRLNIVASEVHAWAKFPERKAAQIFEALDDEAAGTMGERYQTSKLLDVLLTRELADKQPDQSVVINYLNPGFCRTLLGRDSDSCAFAAMQRVLGRTSEVGSRTLVAAAAAGWESHGEYMSNGVVAPHALSPLVTSAEGKELQGRLWGELEAILEVIRPGVMKGLRG